MRKLVIIFMITFVFISYSQALIQESASLIDFIYGNTDQCEYDNWTSHISEGIVSANYNLYAPYDRQTNGFGDFVNATDGDLSYWENIMNAFLEQNFVSAENLLNFSGFPYQIIEFFDTDTNRTYYFLRENLNLDYYDDNGTDIPDDDEIGSFDNGWGLYIFNPAAEYPVVINVVHPCDDFNTIPLAVKAFQDFDAMFLMISGAGREVDWTGVNSYTNSKSLSDPSRVEDHIFNKSYQAACDYLRDSFGRREFSLQIHSYDWNRHVGHNSCQISAGNKYKISPNLPIRDLSFNHIDLINSTPYVVIPANTIGFHPDVTIEDYYCVLNEYGDFYYINGEDSLQVSGDIDLPGYTNNRQLAYTATSWNDYDSFDPFFHIEMDELPNCYPQNEMNYKWFYGYDADLCVFDYDHLFDNTLAYYSPWVNAVANVLEDVFVYNDYSSPDTPQNLQVISQSYDRITLSWQRSSDFDFETYEVLYSQEPIQNGNYSIKNRTNSTKLASQATEELQITGLQPNSQYYFQIRALDYNDNISELSNEISSLTSSAKIIYLKSLSYSEKVVLTWRAQYQQDNAGFVIERSDNPYNGFEVIDSWETNPSLAGMDSTNVDYSYSDIDVQNDLLYYYKVASQKNNGEILYNNDLKLGSPAGLYQISISNLSQTYTDSVRFGYNYSASDYFEVDYDILHPNIPPSDYIYSEFYESSWNNNKELFQNIKDNFDVENEYKTWTYRVKTDIFNEDFSIEYTGDNQRNSEKLYLRRNSNSQYYNLFEENVTFNASNENFETFTLYWGNLKPKANIPNIGNKIFQAGDSNYFMWTNSYNFLADSISVYIQTEIDSIPLATGLPPNVHAFSWTFPENLTRTNCRLIISTYYDNGDCIPSISPYQFAIFPSEYEYYFETGFDLSANPLIDTPISSLNDFGFEGDFFEYSGSGSYNPVELFTSENGCLINCTESKEFSMQGTIQKQFYTRNLIQGFNLIPNLLLQNKLVNDLNFIFNNQNYTFFDAVQCNLISPLVFTYRAGNYRQVKEIQIGESFFITAFADDIEIKIIPFQKNVYYPIYESGWQLALNLQQADIVSNQVFLGVKDLDRESFDENLELHQLPFISEKPNLNLYFVKEKTIEKSRLITDFKPLSMKNSITEKKWEITAEFDNLNPVILKIEKENFPKDLKIFGEIDNEIYEFIDDEISFIPTDYRMSFNIFTRNTNLIAKENVLKLDSVNLYNYPNPFGGNNSRSNSTTIFFNNLVDGNVNLSVYNVKGQRVKILLNEKLKKGSHTINWNGTNSNNKMVSSGVYFLKISTDRRETTYSKLLFLK